MKEWFGGSVISLRYTFPGIYSHYVYISIHLTYLTA